WPGGGEGGSPLGSATPRDGRVRTVALGYQSREVGIRGRSGVRLPRRALHDRCAAFIGPGSLPPLVSGVTWSAVQLIGCRLSSVRSFHSPQIQHVSVRARRRWVLAR